MPVADNVPAIAKRKADHQRRPRSAASLHGVAHVARCESEANRNCLGRVLQPAPSFAAPGHHCGETQRPVLVSRVSMRLVLSSVVVCMLAGRGDACPDVDETGTGRARDTKHRDDNTRTSRRDGAACSIEITAEISHEDDVRTTGGVEENPLDCCCLALTGWTGDENQSARCSQSR